MAGWLLGGWGSCRSISLQKRRRRNVCSRSLSLPPTTYGGHKRGEKEDKMLGKYEQEIFQKEETSIPVNILWEKRRKCASRIGEISRPLCG